MVDISVFFKRQEMIRYHTEKAYQFMTLLGKFEHKSMLNPIEIVPGVFNAMPYHSIQRHVFQQGNMALPRIKRD